MKFEINQEQIQELAKQALESGKEEARFILRLTRGRRPGPSFYYRSDWKVVEGKVDEVVIDHLYDYPTQDDEVVLVIPKAIPTVLIYEHEWDYGEQDQGSQKTVYVCGSNGWRSVEV